MVKVIFLENIEDQKVGDIKEVADGYARNFLFRKGIAKLATDEEVKNLETKLEKLRKEEDSKVKKSEQLADRLQKLDLIIHEEVNEESNLYGAVTNRELAEELTKAGFEIEAAQLEIEEPIKTLGTNEVVVKVGHGVETSLKVTIKRKES